MEYEIGDDPQGLPDYAEARRDGGLRESLYFRKEPKRRPATQLDETVSSEQLGELV